MLAGAFSTVAIAEDTDNNLEFKLTTRAGAQTTVRCQNLESDGTIGVKFLRSLDQGFHDGNYKPAFSEAGIKNHLRFEGVDGKVLSAIESECQRRLGL